MSNRLFRAPVLSRRRWLALAGSSALGVGAGLVPRPIEAAVRVDITQGNVQPISIALPDFVAGTPGEVETAHGRAV